MSASNGECPSIKFQLIDRRDTYMAINLIKLFRRKKYDKIVAVVGEGHLDGIETRLSPLNPRIVRLRDLLHSHNGSFILSYNNCETIREYYKDFDQIFLQ